MRVLVVEDEPLIRLGMVIVVEEAGYDTVEAANADQAIAVLNGDPDIDLVLTDVDMPGSMDGLKLAHYVSERWPPVRLVVVSGKVGVRPEQLPEGARFMSKPYQEAQLVHLVQTMIGAGA